MAGSANMAVGSTAGQPGRRSPVSADPPPWDKPQDGHSESGLAFGAVLAALGTAQASVQRREDSGRASEMFEGPKAEGSPRLAELKTEARAEALRGNERFDKSVLEMDARRETAGGDAAAESLRISSRAKEAVNGSRLEVGGTSTVAEELRPGDASRAAARAEQFGSGSSGAARGQQNGTGGRSESPMTPATVQPPPSSTAATGATATAPASSASVTSNEGSPAGRVAQVLSSGADGQVARATQAGGGTQPGAHRSGSESRTPSQSSAPERTEQGARAAPGDSEPVRPQAFDELVRSIRLRGAERQSSARIQLQPPELGRLNVNVRLEGDILRVEVRTETEEARSVIAERAGLLRSALESVGVVVEQLEVLHDSGSEGRSADGSARNAGENPRMTAWAGRRGSESPGEDGGPAGEDRWPQEARAAGGAPWATVRGLDIRV